MCLTWISKFQNRNALIHPAPRVRDFQSHAPEVCELLARLEPRCGNIRQPACPAILRRSISPTSIQEAAGVARTGASMKPRRSTTKSSCWNCVTSMKYKRSSGSSEAWNEMPPNVKVGRFLHLNAGRPSAGVLSHPLLCIAFNTGDRFHWPSMRYGPQLTTWRMQGQAPEWL